ncbi:tetratricopeptide repeat protein [Desulfovibrio litoralis]|uniref:Import receptor subunit TOM20 n=1 Tax=Desulfovibrio litoralis DSM 11393 TaxID=1121455 RepID=A0A1M7THW9_9BACT|nr:tetratricopeptide repeat protein [Desulfovibrio litoralis]SHN70198.1 import receptor subunit TOM20 [Desulfovibrio litoralis DSM 11393]
MFLCIVLVLFFLQLGVKVDFCQAIEFDKNTNSTTQHQNDALKFYEKSISLYKLAASEITLAENETDRKKIQPLLEEAIKNAEKAIELNSKDSEAFYHLGRCLLELSKLETGENKKQLLYEAQKKCEQAIKLDENNADAFYTWSDCLMELADGEKDPLEKKVLLEKARAKHQEATRLTAIRLGFGKN